MFDTNVVVGHIWGEAKYCSDAYYTANQSATASAFVQGFFTNIEMF